VTIYDLKPAFQNMLRPVCTRLANAGVTANQVTVFALVVSLLLGLLLAMNPETPWLLLCLPVWLFLRMALNAIDGMLAREHNLISRLGGVLNEIGDVVADTALYLPFALMPGISPVLVIGIVILSMLTEMAGVVAVQAGASRRYDGPMGKSDRAFVFGLLALLLGLGIGPASWMNLALGLVALLTALTVVNRLRKALQETVKSTDDENQHG
jgi:CDP-diacylglycerol--glycerol-3-phosphate 3-phosphatidyltransferase